MDFFYSILIAVMNFINQYLASGYFPVTIILFTVLIKLLLSPLDIKQRLSMRRTQALQPKVEALRERYKSDPQKQNQKVMELYKAEKASPMGGCLPMLIQLPILFAMWGVLRIIANEQLMIMFLNIQSGAWDYTDQAQIMQSFLWVHNFWQPDNFMESGSIIPMVSTALAQMKESSASIWLTAENVQNFVANYEVVMTPVIDHYNAIAYNGWGIMPVLVAGMQLLLPRLNAQQQAQAAAPAADGQNPNQMMKIMNYAMPIMFFFFCWNYLAAFSLYLLTSSLFSALENLVLNLYFKHLDKRNELAETAK